MIRTSDQQLLRKFAGLGDEQAFGWGQRLDGTLVEWEVGQGVFVIDPTLARRYGLKIGGQ